MVNEKWEARKMRPGLYRCSHCGLVQYRSSNGNDKYGIQLWHRCGACHFDTLEFAEKLQGKVREGAFISGAEYNTLLLEGAR